MNINKMTAQGRADNHDLLAKIYSNKEHSNTNSIEQKVEPVQLDTNSVNSNDKNSHLAVWLVIYLIAMVAGIALVKIWLQRKSEHKQGLRFWQYLDRVPCRKCQFFVENNPYLKCAVNPYTVLTKDAVNCSDYCPKK
jgi:uncharacterized protein HemX